MKRKRPKEYLPVQFAKTIIPNPESTLYDDVGVCHEHFLKHRNLMQQYGLSYQDEDCKNLSRTLCIVRDWVRTKQAYKITKELAEDLFSMEDMTFPANILRLPYRTVFMDFSDLNIPATGTQRELEDYIIYGVYMTLGEMKYHSESSTMCGFVTLIAPKGEWEITSELCYGGIAFDYDDTYDGQTLKDVIDQLVKQYEGPKESIIKALLFAAYLSSEQPDVEENELQKTFYRPTEKLKNSSVRKWDVGIRYTKEVLAHRRQNTTSIGASTGPSKRPHIRKAHWHIYRIGKGRTNKKVVWLPPIEVNCKEKPELPAVIRETGKQNK